MWRLLALVAFLFFVIHPAPAAAQTKGKAPKLPEGTSEHRDLRYGEHKERNTLDLFVPKSEQPLPLIIWVHGGAWQGGSKAGNNPAVRVPHKRLRRRGDQLPSQPARRLSRPRSRTARRPFASCARTPRSTTSTPTVSASGALPRVDTWWRSSAPPAARRSSRGRTASTRTCPSRVQCVVDFFGPTDLTKMAAQAMAEPAAKSKFDHDAPNSPESKLVGGPIQENKEKAAKANPINYIDKDDARRSDDARRRRSARAARPVGDLPRGAQEGRRRGGARRHQGRRPRRTGLRDAGRTCEKIDDFFEKHLKREVSDRHSRASATFLRFAGSPLCVFPFSVVR